MQDRIVRKPLRGIELPLEKRRRIAAALAVPVLERVTDLVSLQMILHDLRGSFVVVKDPSVGSDPGDPEVGMSKTVKIVPAVESDRLGDELCLIAQLLELLICKMAV